MSAVRSEGAVVPGDAAGPTSPATIGELDATLAGELDATLAAEHETLRSACGLLDRCERGKLALTGAGAAEFLNGQVTNEVLALAPGEGCYAAFLTHKGKMLGDLRILKTSSELLLDTERTALQGLFDMIRKFKIGYEVQLHKRTLQSGLLSLIGPRARQVAQAAVQAGSDDAVPSTVEHSHRDGMIAGLPVRLIATAAPQGIDVLCHADGVEAVKAALLTAGASTVSEEAAEIVRVEHGRPRYGIDLDETVIPQEAGLNERAVSFTKGCYLGQETVARLHYKGKPNRHLRGLRLTAAVPPSAEIRLGERQIGQLTSSVLSPALGPIGLALLRREAEPGATVAIGAAGSAAEVVALPFAVAQR